MSAHLVRVSGTTMTPNENSTQFFGHCKRNTQFLGLIWLEFAVRKGEFSGTTPMLAPPQNPDKPKLFEYVRNVLRPTRPLLKN